MARILVVEDDRVVARHIREVLEKLGHLVVASAASGAKAIQAVQLTKPELVLMDVRLKGNMDGVTVAEQIYNHFDIPVVYLTAYVDEATLQRAKLSAPFGYLIKPLREADLQTTIAITLHRHQLEQGTRRTQQWLAGTLNSIADGAIAIDRNGSITYMNDAAVCLTGWQRQDALGRSVSSVFELVQGETGEPLENPLIKSIQQGITIEFPEHTVLRTRDGMKCGIGDIANPIRNEDGDIIGAVMVFQDAITWRYTRTVLQQSKDGLHSQLQNQTVQLEQIQFRLSVELACNRVLQYLLKTIAINSESAQRLHTVLQQLGSILMADYAWIAHHSQEQEIATITHDYISEQLDSCSLPMGTQIDLQSYPQFYQVLSQRRCWITPPIGILPAPYQSLITLKQQLLICPMYDDQMHPLIGEVGFVFSSPCAWDQPAAELISQVISQAAIASRVPTSYAGSRSNAELNVLKANFVDTISHELRTPLTNMRMAVEMLRRIVFALKDADINPDVRQNQSLLWQRLEQYLQILHDEWQQEFNLITDLLNFQTVEHSHEPLCLTCIDLEQWLPRLVSHFMAQASSKQQYLTCQVSPTLPPIHSHLPSLEGIVKELLTNACKFTPPTHKIAIAAYARGKQLILTCTNTGITIPLMDQVRIFQPFDQVKQLVPQRCSGMGLGLALVKRLVTRLGGTIAVDSDIESTTFNVVLPL